MADEWAGVVNSTAPKYLRGIEDLTARKRLLLAMLKSKGRIQYNCNSYQCTWTVEFSQPAVEPYADGGLLSFQRHDPARQLTESWRG